MIAKLINRLHRVFDKEPRPIPVLTVSTPCIITMSNAVATVLVSGSTHTIATDGMTLSQFVTALGTKGVTATLTSGAYQILIARGVLDTHRQDTTVDNHVYYSSNLFWQEMQVYGWMLQEQSDRLLRAEQQLYLHSAENEWLDYWLKDYFGILRDTSESDAQYKDRAIAEIIRIKQNNKAMEIALKNAVAAVDCIVRDADITNGMSLQYDGTALYVGNDKYAYKYGSQPGCFYITTDLPSEDARTLDQITKTLVGTANKIKAAGTKLDGVVYKTSTSDIAIISEAAILTAKDTQADILPWGLRYDGSVNHSSGRNLFFDGSDTYNGAVPYNLAVDGETTYSNKWDSSTATIHTDQTDQQQASIAYNGLASYDGVFDQGATPPPLYDTRMTVTVRRHNLYSGMRTYGADKQYDGSVMADSTTDYSQMRYEGIHTIQEMTI